MWSRVWSPDSTLCLLFTRTDYLTVARKITHDEEGPLLVDEEELEEQGGTVAVCQCGLSANKPYCDGSHSAIDEDDGVVYEYEGDDDEGERTVVSDD